MEYLGQKAIAMLILGALGYGLANKAKPLLRIAIAAAAMLIIAVPTVRDEFDSATFGAFFMALAALPSLALFTVLAFKAERKRLGEPEPQQLS